jgi:hypothetical protein
MNVAKEAFQWVVLENCGSARGVVVEVDDLARPVDGMGGRHRTVMRCSTVMLAPPQRSCQMSAIDCGTKPGAARRLASAWARLDWTTALSRSVVLAPRGTLLRATSTRQSSAPRAWRHLRRWLRRFLTDTISARAGYRQTRLEALSNLTAPGFTNLSAGGTVHTLRAILAYRPPAP